MFSNQKKYILSFALLGAFLCAPLSVQAQNADEGLADFSLDLDTLPPQPSQTAPVEIQIEPQIEPQPRAPEPVAEAPAVRQELPMPTPEPMAQTQIQPAPVVPQPAETLLAPEMPTPTPVMPSAATTRLDPRPVPHSGTYYDSSSVIPNMTGSNRGVPRVVDPRYEPGSSFVVVEKAQSANSEAARIIAAQRALKLGRYPSALEIYEQLYRKSPRNTQILMGLAVAQQESGFMESAIATYEELLSIDPDNTDATSNMLGILTTQYPSVAYRRLRDMWDSAQGNANIAAQLGLISASMNNNEEALRYLGIAVSMEPQNALHYFNMAVIYDRAGSPKDAIELYQKALEVDLSHSNGRFIERKTVHDRLAQLRRL